MLSKASTRARRAPFQSPARNPPTPILNLSKRALLAPMASRGLANYKYYSSTDIKSPVEFIPELHPTYRSGVPRILPQSAETNALEGEVKLSLPKLAWVSSMFGASLLGAYLTWDPSMLLENLSVFFVTSGLSILFGHSLGMHRRFIHKSYKCPKWLEYFFVHLGTIMGIAGPLTMIKGHDFRDWAQRQPPGHCHPFFSQQQGFLKDSYWQMLCSIHLKHPPQIKYEKEVAEDKVYQWMEKYWMAQQVPWAALLGLIGGWSWVVWGVLIRASVSMYGHFFVGWFAHNEGSWSRLHWNVNGAAVQGQNVGGSTLISKVTAIMTAGESYHNNHHAYPGSARLAHEDGEIDLGFRVLKFLERFGLVWDLRLPEDLPPRPELEDRSI